LNETAEDERTQPDQIESPSEPATEAARFPWPPADTTGVVSAFAQTVEQSIRTPTAFFRAMPRTAYASAITYCLIAGMLAAGMRLFWSNIFALFGYEPLSQVLLGGSFDAVDRLIGFLFEPLLLLGVLFGGALIVHASLLLVGAARAPFVTTTRTFAFSFGPQLFEAVPFIGSSAALAGTLILLTIGLREAHQTSTRRVVVALVLPVVALGLLLLIALLLFVLGSLGVLLTRVPV
jgi:hypothetical protein